ncbi:MAG: haloacid dehalogenase type II [Chloroflexota bacterium]
MPAPRICVFDVNETLLDLGALDLHFKRVFGDAGIRRTWFNQLLQSALVSTVLDNYSDFGTIGDAALTMVAAREGVELTDADRSTILGVIRELPPHADAREGLQRLRSEGLRLAALTNSTPEVAEQQITNAGLSDYFELVLSADTVRRLKPAPEPYRIAAEKLGVDVKDIRLVAAHDWDVAGAMRAGCSAAFVARPGMTLNPLFAAPDVVGADLVDVAKQILDREARPS